MPRRSLEQVDLNLLVDLERLLQEEHVGRAAALAGLSDSTMSRRLSQLRKIFDDPLLVSQGRTLVRTPHGETLLPRLRPILAAIEDGLFAAKAFEPSEATGTWTIATTDSTHQLFAGPFVRIVRAAAPGLVLRFIGPEVLAQGGLDSGAAELGIGPRPSADSVLRMRPIFSQGFSTLVSPEHPLVRGVSPPQLDLDAFCEAEHGLVAVTARPGSLVDDALAAVGRTRRVVAIAQHFRTAAPLVRDAGLLFTVPSLIARMLAREHGLLALAPPVSLPRMVGAMVWHPRFHEDPAHAWVRTQMLEAVQQTVADLDDEERSDATPPTDEPP